MITAKLNDELINCYDGTLPDEALRRHSASGDLICPACGGRYEYCNGEFVSAYFRHKTKDDCDRFSETETEEHQSGKRKLFEWIRTQDGVTNAVLEGWIPETRQRPDIMFSHNGRRYVIEYQCTPISTQWVERTELYDSLGISSIWILGTKNYLWYQDPCGSRSKRFKRIEEFQPIYFDSSADVLLCGTITASRAGFKYSFRNETFAELLECISKWGVGTLAEKSNLVCAKLSSFKFDKKIINDVSKNERYSKVLKRLVNVKKSISEFCANSIEYSFPNSLFKWTNANMDSLSKSGELDGEFVVQYKTVSGVDVPIIVKFSVSYELCKCGLEWCTSICVGKRIFETNYMPMNALETYMNIALPIRVRQIIRLLYESPDKCKKKMVSKENFDPSKPYEYNKCNRPSYRIKK